MANPPTSIDSWLKRSLSESPPRSKSLIITIFGDLIAPHMPGLWLSELIALLAPFQVNERLVRTSSFRLMEEGWLESQREGRRSRYALTTSGLQRVEHAYHRIYDPPPQSWNGRWTFVILNKIGNAAFDRLELRRELGWEGFGLLAPGIFLHPCADLHNLRQILERLGLSHSVSVLDARSLDEVSSCPVSTLIGGCWNLQAVAAHYEAFLDQFEPVLPMLKRNMDPQTAYVVQTLLIHAFRRVVLHDPRIPAILLPEAWPGHKAYELCRGIYAFTSTLAQNHLKARLLAPASLQSSLSFSRRFERPKV